MAAAAAATGGCSLHIHTYDRSIQACTWSGGTRDAQPHSRRRRTRILRERRVAHVARGHRPARRRHARRDLLAFRQQERVVRRDVRPRVPADRRVEADAARCAGRRSAGKDPQDPDLVPAGRAARPAVAARVQHPVHEVRIRGRPGAPAAAQSRGHERGAARARRRSRARRAAQAAARAARHVARDADAAYARQRLRARHADAARRDRRRTARGAAGRRLLRHDAL